MKHIFLPKKFKCLLRDNLWTNHCAVTVHQNGTIFIPFGHQINYMTMLHICGYSMFDSHLFSSFLNAIFTYMFKRCTSKYKWAGYIYPKLNYWHDKKSRFNQRQEPKKAFKVYLNRICPTFAVTKKNEIKV